MRERRGLFRDLMGKPKGKRPLGRSEVNSKIDLTDRDVDWIDLA